MKRLHLLTEQEFTLIQRFRSSTRSNKRLILRFAETASLPTIATKLRKFARPAAAAALLAVL